jgi:hypothetical protein
MENSGGVPEKMRFHCSSGLTSSYRSMILSIGSIRVHGLLVRCMDDKTE